MALTRFVTLQDMPPIRKSSYTSNEFWDGQHRFEHWYRDNSVYFITSRVREGFAAFETEAAKSIFWDRFYHYTKLHRFVPWVTTLMINHYHTLGYLKFGKDLGEMMRKIHGSVAWLVMKEINQARAVLAREGEQGLLRRVYSGRAPGHAGVPVHAVAGGAGGNRGALGRLSPHAGGY